MQSTYHFGLSLKSFWFIMCMDVRQKKKKNLFNITWGVNTGAFDIKMY